MTSEKENMILVSFWGTRGSVSTPGRMTEKYGGNTPCVALRYKDIQVIFDAGTGIRNLGFEIMREINDSKKPPPTLHLFISHTHWDHIQGLPFFQPSYHKDIRITIYGSPRKERFLESILKEQMDFDYFPVSMSSFQADITIKEMQEEIIRLGPLTVEWQEQICHPGGSVRYRVDVDGKTVVYATDVELNSFYGPQVGDKGKKKLSKEYMNFIYNADLLIADAQYTEDEYPDKVGWGHTSVPVLLDAAFRAKVKQVAVFHHDPQHSDTFLDELWMRNRYNYHKGDKKMDIFWAREGMTLSL